MPSASAWGWRGDPTFISGRVTHLLPHNTPTTALPSYDAIMCTSACAVLRTRSSNAAHPAAAAASDATAAAAGACALPGTPCPRLLPPGCAAPVDGAAAAVPSAFGSGHDWTISCESACGGSGWGCILPPGLPHGHGAGSPILLMDFSTSFTLKPRTVLLVTVMRSGPHAQQTNLTVPLHHPVPASTSPGSPEPPTQAALPPIPPSSSPC